MARKGIGLGKGVLKIGDIIIDDRLRVGAVLWLADKYNKPVSEVMKVFITKPGEDGTKNIVNLMIALAIQRNPEKTEVDVKRAINQLDLGEFSDISLKLTSALNADVKNSKRPVAGNLQE